MVGAVVTDYGAGVRIVAVSKEHIHGAAVESSANEHGPVWMRLRKERCTAVDTEDGATIGCLTRLVREMWGAPVVARVASVFPDGSPEWAVCDLPDREPMYLYESEWSALMAAGDAAWARRETSTPKDAP